MKISKINEPDRNVALNHFESHSLKYNSYFQSLFFVYQNIVESN